MLNSVQKIAVEFEYWQFPGDFFFLGRNNVLLHCIEFQILIRSGSALNMHDRQADGQTDGRWHNYLYLHGPVVILW